MKTKVYRCCTVYEEKPRIDQPYKKYNSGLDVIRRVKQIADSHTTKIAYFSLFEAHLRNSIPFGEEQWTPM